MLTSKENKMLTEVGGGSPMGEFMRRYWIPAAKSEEIPMPGGAPARVKLLGERLVLFRSHDGKLGLIDEFCPHRRASLAYGRNEPGGLRCLYHGWKVACDGRVLESPPEPAARTFARKLSVASYPAREAGGLIWTYMGPRELEPPFPKFPWLDLPLDRLLVVKMYQATNYLQGVEGDLDDRFDRTQPRRPRRHQVVACQRQFEPAAEAQAVHRADDRHRILLERAQRTHSVESRTVDAV